MGHRTMVTINTHTQTHLLLRLLADHLHAAHDLPGGDGMVHGCELGLVNLHVVLAKLLHCLFCRRRQRRVISPPAQKINPSVTHLNGGDFLFPTGP